MARFRLSVRSLMVSIAFVAVCFAVFGLYVGGILSVSALVVILNPHPFRWETLERGATVAWLFSVILMASNVSIDPIGVACVVFPTGLLLGFTWLLRQACELDKPHVRHGWSELMFTPGSCLLGLVLLNTDLDLRLRLVLSEPALRAEARRLPRGFQDRWWPARHTGLFRVYAVEERDGCVLWDTGDNSLSFMTTEGLAYVPGGRTPAWAGYRFRHVRGPWWKYSQTFD